MAVRLGPYELLAKLSSSSTSSLYLARGTVQDQSKLLAVKILERDTSGEPLQRFLSEARVLGQLHHRNVIETAGYGQIDGLHCLAMEFVFGVDLVTALREGGQKGKALSIASVLGVVAGICEGLHYAHTATDQHGRHMRLIHRGVTPRNILVSFSGRPKLRDFGLSKTDNRDFQTVAGMMVGRFRYASPEQLRGQAIDARSDIFCTGIVLWEMLTGRTLFPGRSLVEISRAMNNPMPRPSQVVQGVPDSVDGVVMRALQTDPTQRFQSAGEMAQSIHALLRSASISMDDAKIAMELAGIFGEDIARKAIILRYALSGRAELQQLYVALGASPVNRDDLFGSDDDFRRVPLSEELLAPAGGVGGGMPSAPSLDRHDVKTQAAFNIPNQATEAAPRDATSTFEDLDIEEDEESWTKTQSANLGDDLQRALAKAGAEQDDANDDFIDPDAVTVADF